MSHCEQTYLFQTNMILALEYADQKQQNEIHNMDVTQAELMVSIDLTHVKAKEEGEEIQNQ